MDSLDSLSDEDGARSSLSFLADFLPHRDTKIILSTLPDNETFYGCQTLLAHYSVMCINFDSRAPEQDEVRIVVYES